MSTDPSRPVGWLLRPAENDDAPAVAARWLRSVRCGERDDYALVELDPAVQPQDSGATQVLRHVVLAPRHQGVNLTASAACPIHVYVASLPDSLRDAASIRPEELTIRIWGILTNPLDRPSGAVENRT